MSQNLSIQQTFLSHQGEEKEQEKLDAVFRLFNRAGGMGRYQKITLVFWCTCLYLTGGLTLVIPYLFYQDPYQCPDSITDQTCNDYVCSLPPSERDQFTPSPSMATMANQFGDYRCSPESSSIDVAVFIIFLSTVLSFLLLTVFGDYLGRKKFIIVGLGLTIGGMVITLLSVNLMMGAIGMLIGCLGAQWIYTVSMLYITQTVKEKYRERFLVISQSFYGIGSFFNAGYFYIFLDWKLVFIVCYLLPAGLTLIGVIFFTIDSPICLIRKMTSQGVKQQFEWVARVNGVLDFSMELEEIEQIKKMEQIRQKEEQSSSKFTFLDLFRYRSLRLITICSVILENSMLFLFYAPTLMIADLQFNIFVNGLVIGASSLISYPVCYFIIQKIKRKVMAILCFSIVLILSIILIFLWHPKNDEIPQPLSEHLGSLAAFIIISFVITLQYNFFEVYLLEIYPTQVRLIGGSFVTFVSGITTCFSDFIINGCARAGFSVMIVFSGLAALSIIASLMLPQTLNKTPPDFIKELTEKRQSMDHSTSSTSNYSKVLKVS